MTKRIDARAWPRLTFAQQGRWCHLCDLLHVTLATDEDPHAQTEAQWREARRADAQRAHDAADRLLFGN